MKYVPSLLYSLAALSTLASLSKAAWLRQASELKLGNAVIVFHMLQFGSMAILAQVFSH